MKELPAYTLAPRPPLWKIAVGGFMFLIFGIAHIFTGIGDASLDLFRFLFDASFRSATRERWKSRGKSFAFGQLLVWLIEIALVILIVIVGFTTLRDWMIRRS